MGIIQRIKEFFSGVLPLHLNATVRDLEERLEAVEFMEGIQRLAVDTLKEINREFFQENQKLLKALDDAREERARADSYKKRLGEIYRMSSTFDFRGLDKWPIEGFIDHRFSHHGLGPQHLIQLRLESLALTLAIPEEMRLVHIDYDIWAATYASHLGEVAKNEVSSKVTELLSLHKYRRNLHKETE